LKAYMLAPDYTDLETTISVIEVRHADVWRRSGCVLAYRFFTTKTMTSPDSVVWLCFPKTERRWLFCTLQQVMCRVALLLDITPVKFQDFFCQ
jgi:hypothetical protein